MNIFTKLFRSKSATSIPVQAQAEQPSQEEVPTDMLHDLFTDNQPPVAEEKTLKNSSPLQDFLSINYASKGLSDGYEHHNPEFLSHNVEVIKADFRLIIDQAIDVHRQDLYQVRYQRVDAKGLSERLEEQIELRITEIKGLISKLDDEKKACDLNQGLVSKPIAEYHEGFIRGFKEYHELKLFAQSTGLF